MARATRNALWVAGAAALGGAWLAPPRGNPERPPPGHTGGFGEPACDACHAGGPLDDPAGSLAVRGLPDVYRPGAAYRIVITLTHPELERGGFQAAVRFVDGPSAGRQAGALGPADGNVEVVTAGPLAVRYAQHTRPGTSPATPHTTAWTVLWTAPAAGDVMLHVAANAANGDDSPLGDFVYSAGRRSARR